MCMNDVAAIACNSQLAVNLYCTRAGKRYSLLDHRKVQYVAIRVQYVVIHSSTICSSSNTRYSYSIIRCSYSSIICSYSFKCYM
jgi:hypothetical protein